MVVTRERVLGQLTYLWSLLGERVLGQLTAYAGNWLSTPEASYCPNGAFDILDHHVVRACVYIANAVVSAKKRPPDVTPVAILLLLTRKSSFIVLVL